MPGYELIGEEEKQAIIDLFEANSGVLFAHGFVDRRKGIFKVREFERQASKYFGCKYVQAVSSGSAALVVALKALGVKPGDEVITQAFTFVATVEAIIMVGAIPIITEIDETYNMDPADFEARITPRTKVVIPVHMLGAACNMDKILEIAKKHNIKVLEDAAQSSGAKYNDQYLGTLGDMGIFSLDFIKNFTSGEGGLILTDNEEYFNEARAYHDHGHEYNPNVPRGNDTRHMAGFNFRMSELQAVIGIVQLSKLKYIVDKQLQNKTSIKKGFSDGPALKFRKVLNYEQEGGDAIIFNLGSKEQANDFAKKLYEASIGTKNLPDAIDWHFAGTWKHMLKDFPGMEEPEALWPITKDLLERSVAIPININMSEEQKGRAIELLRQL